jgi:glycosyltransferase involved in cell wall biosynthesis
MVKPLITTIIPTFRRPDLLRRAITSVLNQTFPYFKLCVYDNASGDDTAEIVNSFAKHDPRVNYYCHSENIGAIANFNFGMTQVQTRFFSFLCDDDILLPEFYQTTLEGFNKFPNSAFSAGSVISMTAEGQILSHQLSLWPRYGYYEPPEGLVEMLGGKHPTCTGVLFRKEIISEVGMLDEEVGPYADMDFELRIAAKFPFVLAEQPCAIFVYQRHSMSNSINDLSYCWPGMAKIIINIDNDKDIPLYLKIHACDNILRQIKKYLFNTGFILNKNYRDAYKCAFILDSYFNDKLKSAVMYNIIKLSELNSLVFNVLQYRDNYRKMVQKFIKRNLQEKYISYTKYLSL